MVEELLKPGKENARSGKELAQALGMNIRALTLQIEEERRQGVPICAVSNGPKPGYFIATTPEEVEAYCRALKHRAVEIFKTRQAMLKASERIKTE